MKYEFMQANQNKFEVHVMARVLNVTTQAYQAWKRRGVSARAKEDALLREEVKTIHEKSKRTYGSPRVKATLLEKGKRVSRARVNRLMREANCETKYRKRFVRTTQSKHSSSIAENTLNREFKASRPNQKWVSDITYLPTGEGWLYLAVVLDLYSRKIIGWAFGTTLEKSLVLQALGMARDQREPDVEKGLLHHSDRGSQYASVEYRQALRLLRATCSMSRKGNCWDNAVMESFFNTLKLELDLDSVIGGRDFTRSTVFAWIEGWYNRQRLHSSLGYVTPVAFEAKFLD